MEKLLMTAEQIIFLIVAAVTLIAAISVVTSRNLIHSALWLILTLSGIAIFYVLLNVGFFAVIQVVVYIGAIAILFIFAAMLTRRVMQDTGPQSNSNWWLGVLIALSSLAGILLIFINWPGFKTMPPVMLDQSGKVVQLGLALVSPDRYLLPFELASVLLVAGMIGAIFVAGEKKQ
jgi:NADH-quinone oxidoreductase subunit J